MTGPTNPCLRVYAADVSPLENDDLYQELYRLVRRERKEKTSKLHFRKDRCLSLGAEYLLLQSCRDFGVDYSNEPIVTDEFGKPRFARLPLFFNLSHSGKRVMCIMSNLEVGCDVEEVRPVEPELARRFFSPEENSVLSACRTPEEYNDLFFRLWTLKESFVKCVGRGFQLSPASFSVLPQAGGFALQQSFDQCQYFLNEEIRSDGYKYSWCVKTGRREEYISHGNLFWKHF